MNIKHFLFIYIIIQLQLCFCKPLDDPPIEVPPAEPPIAEPKAEPKAFTVPTRRPIYKTRTLNPIFNTPILDPTPTINVVNSETSTSSQEIASESNPAPQTTSSSIKQNVDIILLLTSIALVIQMMF